MSLSRRILWLIVMMFASFAVLLGRLFQVSGHWMAPMHGAQRWQSQSVAKADLEHLHVEQTDDGRGRILFANGAPWSGTKIRKQIVIAAHRHWVTYHSERTDGAINEPLIGEVGRADVWPSPAMSVDELGRSGLERTFDETLRAQRAGYVGELRDVHGRVVSPHLYAIAAQSGRDLRTTIDMAWQKKLETVFHSQKIRNGAIVVLDVQTNDVLAMVSHNQDVPGQLTAVHAATPGSIFKVITAAAALDSYKYSLPSQFFCPGRVEIPGVQMNCWRRHGHESLFDAFAASCDVAFADVAVHLGRDRILHMANQFHLTEPGIAKVHGKPVLGEEESGVVFMRKGDDAGLLANSGIGQQDVRITPLQAANIARTVANQGVYQDARLVADIEKHGQRIEQFGNVHQSRAISPATATKLAAAMQAAVQSKSGTAHDLADNLTPVAVKTGTAELPASRVNAWMIGFAPANDPKIAFCVFVGGAKSDLAHKQTNACVDGLLRTYRQIRSPSVIH